jgi:hypothetical protein
MELESALESAPEWYWMEMGRVARKMVEEFSPSNRASTSW